jgi:1,4-dihydroxy-2-naphthoate octaprenyltransferase
MVFVFFGLVATCGSAYVMVETIPAGAWWCGSALGLLAVAILLANNLRDIPTDGQTGKRTLAVRIGDATTRRLYRATVIASFVVIAVGVTDEEDLGVGVLEAELRNGLFDRRHILFEIAVDEDVALRGAD